MNILKKQKQTYVDCIQKATYVPNLKDVSWFMRPWLQKNVSPIFSCKVGQSDPVVMKLKLDMSCHLLTVYSKFQIDISKHAEKSPENSDGWANGQTYGQSHGTAQYGRFWNGCTKMKKIAARSEIWNALRTSCYRIIVEDESMRLFVRRIVAQRLL